MHIKKNILLILLFMGLLFGIPLLLYARTLQIEGHWAKLGVIIELIKDNYVKKEVDEGKLLDGAIQGTLKALNDPYTRYLEPEGYKEMEIRMQGELSGVGIEIGMKDTQLTVINPIEGSPAEKAGINPLDKILAIDGDKTEGISLSEAVSKIRGPKGSPVVLRIQHLATATPVDITLVRDLISIKSIGKAEFVSTGVGYIRLATFESKNTAKELETAIHKLEDSSKPFNGLILDLRNNGGGLLEEAIDITSMFVEDGNVVHVVNRDGIRSTSKVRGKAIYPKKPLVVLINEASASASEILAGAIMDNNRGTIVGRPSFGKASVQNVFELTDRSALLLTIAKYLTPSGRDIAEKGIIPDIDIVIPTTSLDVMRKEDYVYKYEDDVQLQKAINVINRMINP